MNVVLSPFMISEQVVIDNIGYALATKMTHALLFSVISSGKLFDA